MIWGQTTEQPAQGLHARQACTARNPLLLFEPRPVSPWPFNGREMAPQWERHIERLQQVHGDRRAMN